MDDSCLFCGLIATGSASWVAQDERAVAFLPLPGEEIAPGHTLVAPRRHTDKGVLDAPLDDLADTTALAQRVAQAMVTALGATGVCVLNASGPGSGRNIDHLHLHVVPRYPGDGEDCLPWPTGRSTHVVDGDPRVLLSAALGEGDPAGGREQVDLAELRGATYARDVDRVMAALRDRDHSRLLQRAGAGVLLALAAGAVGADALAGEITAELDARDWPGDAELAEDLRNQLAGTPTLGRRLPVDLDDLTMLLEGDVTTNEGGFLDLRTGEVLPHVLTDPAEVGDDAAVDVEEEPDRWLYVPCEGSRDGWRDMADYVEQVQNPLLRDRLERAIEGRGAFRRFKDILFEEGLQDGWHAFSDERQAGRARAWLADNGVRAVP